MGRGVPLAVLTLYFPVRVHDDNMRLRGLDFEGMMRVSYAEYFILTCLLFPFISFLIYWLFASIIIVGFFQRSFQRNG